MCMYMCKITTTSKFEINLLRLALQQGNFLGEANTLLHSVLQFGPTQCHTLCCSVLCDILQHIHCNTLQHTYTASITTGQFPRRDRRTATHSNILQHVYGNTLQHTNMASATTGQFSSRGQEAATHCNTLQHIDYNTLQHTNMVSTATG